MKMPQKNNCHLVYGLRHRRIFAGKWKHCPWGWLITVLLMLSIILPGQTTATDSGELEKQLLKAQGRERLTIILELTENYYRSAPQKALEHGKQGLELLKQFPDPTIEIQLLNHLSEASALQTEYAQAIRYAQRSRTIAQQNHDPLGEADAILQMALVYWYQSEYHTARDLYNDAHQRYLQLGNQERLARSYSHYGTLYLRINDFSRALEFFFEANKIFKRLGDKEGIASVKNSTGAIYFELEEYERCLEYFLEAEQMYKIQGDREGYAKTRNNIAIAYSRLGKNQEALSYLEQALQASREVGLKQFIPTILSNFGEVYASMGRYWDAINYLSQALALTESLDDERAISYILVLLAQTNRKLGRNYEALPQLHRAFEISQRKEAKADIKNAAQELAALYEEKGNHQEAIKYFEIFKNTSDQLFEENSRKKIDEIQTSYELDKKEREIELLKKDKEIQQIELSRQKSQSISYFIVAFLILILALVTFARYRLRTRITRALRREVEEHKVTTEKLKESEEKFRELAEKSVVGIFIIQDFTFKYVNPRFLEILDYTLGDVINQDPLNYIHTDDRPIIREKIEYLSSGGTAPLTVEYRGITRHGQVIFLESHGSPTQYQGNPAVLGTVIDITDRKKAETELMKSMKLESIGILAGGIAHDFNNLLTIIIENISKVKGDLNIDPPTVQMLDSVEKASQQAAELSQKLITFSEGGWFAPQKLSLSYLLKETALYYPRMKELSPIIRFQPNLSPINGDERQLRRVIQNLIQNADEATTGVKRIVIEAVNTTLEYNNDLSLDSGDYVKVTITDNGKGIAPEHLEKVFDPYFSTKDTVTQKGMGLGLAICYSIIKKHQGYMAVHSQVGVGTSVEIYLPVYSDGIESPVDSDHNI